MNSRKSHCLLCLARRHGVNVPTMPPVAETVICLLLTLLWLLAAIVWTLAAAIVVKRQPRRQSTGIPASALVAVEDLCPAQVLPAAADVATACVDDIADCYIIATVAAVNRVDNEHGCHRLALPVVTLPVPLPLVPVKEFRQLPGFYPLNSTEGNPASKPRRQPALAQRAAQKAEEKLRLAAMSVRQLRQMAARQGVKNTRTARKDALLSLLSSRP